MPFNSPSEIELNFIWLGGKEMPAIDMQNLLKIMAENPEVSINIWVDSKETYNAISKQMSTFKSTVEKKTNKKISYANLSFKQISKAGLQIPDEIDELLIATIDAQLWAAASDIYRVLILTRKDEKSKHARFYYEADNKMSPKLFDFFANRDAAGTALSSNNGMALFSPQHIRQDMFYIDVTSKNGSVFAQNMRQHLITYLCDPIMQVYFKELLHNAKNGGLNAEDVMCSYGMIVQSMFRMNFMTDNPSKLYSLADHIVPMESIRELIGPVDYTKAQSWATPGKRPIDDGILDLCIFVRMAELSDKSGEILKFFFAFASHKFGTRIYSKQEFMAAVNDALTKLYKDKPLPAWFTTYQELDSSTRVTSKHRRS